MRKSLSDLRAAIGSLETKGSNNATAFEAKVDEIVPVAKKLVTDGPISVAVAVKASEAIAAIQPLELADPTRAAINRAAALSTALQQDGLVKTYPALTSALKALFGHLDSVEAVDFLEAVKRRASSLRTLLGQAETVGGPTSIDAITEITALDAAILTYRKQADPMVDILNAEYGDLRDFENPRRRRPQLCDATNEMRKQCQGKRQCALPAPETVCKYDPGLFVPKEHKGVGVLFRCVDPLLTVYAAPALSGMQSRQGNSNLLLMRAAGEEIRCAPAKPNELAKK